MTNTTGQNQRDRHVGTVLQGLRHAAPDAAMQDRLLATLRRAEEVRGDAHVTALEALRCWCITTVTRPLATPRPVVLPPVAAAVLLCAVCGSLLHFLALHHHGAAASTHGVVATSLAREQPKPIRASADLANSVPHAWPTRAMAHAHPAERMPAVGRLAPKLEASSPPPPLPLTDQERLLLRLARREPTEQLAALTSSAQEAAFQQGKDAVSEFFATSPALDEPDDEGSSAP